MGFSSHYDYEFPIYGNVGPQESLLEKMVYKHDEQISEMRCMLKQYESTLRDILRRLNEQSEKLNLYKNMLYEHGIHD